MRFGPVVTRSVSWVRENRILSALIFVLGLNFAANLVFFSFNKASADHVSFFLLRNSFFKEHIFIFANGYFLKLPFYFITAGLLGLTRLNLVVLNLVNAGLMFGMFGALYLNFVKAKQAKTLLFTLFWILPLFVLVNRSEFFWRDIMHPFCRNSEIGLVCLILLWRAKDKTSKYSYSILALVLMTALFFSDPYWIFVFALPYLVAVLLVGSVQRQVAKQDVNLVYYMLIAVVSSVLYRYILNQSDLFTLYTTNSSLVTIDRVGYNLRVAGEGFLRLFDSYVLEGNMLSVPGMAKAVNLLLLLPVLAGLGKLFADKLKSRETVWLFVPLSFGITFLAYASSTVLKDIGTTRYLIILVFWAAFGLFYFLQTYGTRYRKVGLGVVLLLLLAVPSRLVDAGASLTGIPATAKQYETSFAILQAIEAEGLEYGYGEYWDAVLATYLSKEAIRIRQVAYWFGQVSMYPWITSSSWYEPDFYEGSTFLLLRQAVLDEQVGEFTFEQLLPRQFGQPARVRQIGTSDGKFKLFVYDYNIAGRLEAFGSLD